MKIKINRQWYFAFVLMLLSSVALSNSFYYDQIEECDNQIGVSIPEFTCEDLGNFKKYEPPGITSSLVGGQGNGSGDCKYPGLLAGNCAPGSTVAVLYESPDVQIVASCRIPPGENYYDDVAVIQHNRNNGATCFLQAHGTLSAADIKRPSLGVQLTQDGGSWEFGFEDCTRCHDNGPFLRTPYMGAATDDKHRVPGMWTNFYYTDNSPYWNVPIPEERFLSIQVENSNCLNCHRLSSLWVYSFDFEKYTTRPEGTASHYALLATADNYVDNAVDASSGPSNSTKFNPLTSANLSEPTNEEMYQFPVFSTDAFKFEEWWTYIPWNYITLAQKFDHSSNDPIWMPPGAATYSQANFEAAVKIDTCRRTSPPYDSIRPNYCKPAIEHPRHQDLPALGKYGSEISWYASHVGSHDAIRTGDYNGDGREDVFVVIDDTSIIIYIMQADGRSSLADVEGWDHAAFDTYTGDFNGDGYADLLYRDGGQFTILLNDQAGAFVEDVTVNFNTANTSIPLVIGDFDGDDHDDIGMLLNDGRFFIGYNFGPNPPFGEIGFGGSSHFQLQGSAAYASAIVAGDVNGDGYDDLAYSLGSAWTSLINQYDRGQTEPPNHTDPDGTRSGKALKLGEFAIETNADLNIWPGDRSFMGDFNGDRIADMGFSTSNSAVNGGKTIVSIRYGLKGTVSRMLKNKAAGCMKATNYSNKSNDDTFVKFDTPKVNVKNCNNNDILQQFYIAIQKSVGDGLNGHEEVQIINKKTQMNLWANSNKSVKQSSPKLRGNSDIDQLTWSIEYIAGDLKYFRIRSVAYPNKCLYRKSSNKPLALGNCSTNNSRYWTYQYPTYEYNPQ